MPKRFHPNMAILSLIGHSNENLNTTHTSDHDSLLYIAMMIKSRDTSGPDTLHFQILVIAVRTASMRLALINQY